MANQTAFGTPEYDRHMLRETYLNHPCRRSCTVGEIPKICKYKFVVSRGMDKNEK